MKIRILDRILVAVAGVILVAACAGLVAQVFFGVDIAGEVTAFLNVDTTARKIIIGAAAAVLLILGLYCLLMLFRHRKRRDKFVLQKLESGDLAISLDTLETMVRKCVDQHDEIQTESIRLENQRDGLLIKIRGKVAGGVSIPLTVDSLQKQVKQYVTACSGVEVKGIRVQIESSGEDAKDAPFLIEPPAGNRLPRGGETSEETEKREEAAEETPQAPAEIPAEAPAEIPSAAENAAAAAMAAAESMMNSLDYEDDRPIHQQLFSTQEEPCIMPLPPENLVNAAEETAETVEGADTAEAEKPAETAEASENTETTETAEAAENAETAEPETEEAAADERKGAENA